MAIPECIRLVCRPKNTVVVKMGNLYAVRTVIPMSERKNKNTKLGSVIGYIINLKYVPIEKIYVKKEQKYPYMVSFAREVLLLSVGYDTLLNLFETFNIEVAMQIFIISCLKVIHPGVTERDINGYYKNSYLSVLFPDVHLSKNIVSNIYSYIGNDFKSCSDYKKKILDVVSLSDVIYIDGTYEQYNSFRNSLSKTPIKNKYKGYDVINVICSFISNSNDIVSSVYPGSFSDTSLFKKYICENKIYKGVFVGDAAFVPSIIRNLRKSSPEYNDLSYIGLLRSNDIRINKYKLYTYESVFDSAKGKVYYKKNYDETINVFYYAFKNINIGHEQEKRFATRELNDVNSSLEFSKKYDASKDSFGSIVVESPLDMPPDEIYSIIIGRWVIETIFQKKKSNLDLNETRVHSEPSVIGQEFINSIATSMHLKECEKIRDSNILKNSTFKSIFEQLSTPRRIISDEEREKSAISVQWILTEGLPSRNDSSWVNTSQKVFDFLEALNLLKPDCSKPACSQPMQQHSYNIEVVDEDNYEGFIQEVQNQSKNLEYSVNKLRKRIKFLPKQEDESNISTVNDTSPQENFQFSNDSSEQENQTKDDDSIIKENKGGRPKGSLNKKTIRLNHLREEINKKFDALADGYKSVIKDLQEYHKLKNSNKENELSTSKLRKTRSDKGKPRKPYKKHNQNIDANLPSDADRLTNELDRSTEDHLTRHRKTRSDKGKPRKPYKKGNQNDSENSSSCIHEFPAEDKDGYTELH